LSQQNNVVQQVGKLSGSLTPEMLFQKLLSPFPGVYRCINGYQQKNAGPNPGQANYPGTSEIILTL